MNAPAPVVRPREGFALATALLALVVVGALVTGGFFAANQEGRIGVANRHATQAFYAAERGLHEALGRFTRTTLKNIAVDDVVLLDSATYRSGGVDVHYEVSVRRMADLVFYFESTGAVVGGNRLGGAIRRVGLTARAFGLFHQADQAIQTYGGLSVTGNSFVNGFDAFPANWEDCTIEGAFPGIEARDSARVDIRASATVTGNPPVLHNPLLERPDFLDFGDLTYEEVAALADTQNIFPTGTTVFHNTGPAYTESGECDPLVRHNWGAPESPGDPCHFYFPIIYSQGNLHLNSSTAGQGILLVDGDLHINGSFRFYGLVVVKGSFRVGSGAAQIHGGLFLWEGGQISNNSVLTGTPVVQYSTCAVRRAVDFNAKFAYLVPIAERSWVDLTTAGG